MNNEFVMVPRELLEKVSAIELTGADAVKKLAASKMVRDLLAQPAAQHQGEPVAWVYMRNGEVNYDSDIVISNTDGDTLGDGDSWEPVYAHADPGEVERLRGQINEWTGKWEKAISAGAVMEGERNTLRAKLAALRELKLPEFLKLSDEMRAAGDHAEQRAREDQCYSVPVLKAVFFEAAIQRWLDDQEEALSASAEPSAPVEMQPLGGEFAQILADNFDELVLKSGKGFDPGPVESSFSAPYAAVPIKGRQLNLSNQRVENLEALLSHCRSMFKMAERGGQVTKLDEHTTYDFMQCKDMMAVTLGGESFAVFIPIDKPS